MNKIYMNLNNYSTISERLYPGVSIDIDYALYMQDDDVSYIMQYVFNLPTCPQKYWKRVGQAIIEMTQAEKDAVELVIQKIELARLETLKDLDNLINIENYDKLIKSFALVVLDEINILRVKVGLTERTKTQLKSAITSKYNKEVD